MTATDTAPDNTPDAPDALPPEPSSTGSRRRLARIVGTTVAVAIVAAVTMNSLRSSPGSTVPTQNAAVEAAWGIRPLQVATSGDDGFIDFRFVVVDTDKAIAMMQTVSNLPVLRSERNGKVLTGVAAMSTRHDLAVGRTYFLLYRNDEGSVKRGTRVTIQFRDGSNIQHVVAK